MDISNIESQSDFIPDGCEEKNPEIECGDKESQAQKPYDREHKTRIYVYNGSILKSVKEIVCNEYKAVTIASSRAQAVSNVLYRFKRDHGLPIDTRLYLGNYFTNVCVTNKKRKKRFVQPKLALDFNNTEKENAHESNNENK